MQTIVNVDKIEKYYGNKGNITKAIDDVYTTGNTVNECSKILSSTGCKEISIITLAKD